MTPTGFAAQLAQDLDPEDLRLVLGVFRQDVDRLLGVLDATVAAGDVGGFRRTCHALAGAAGAVGATALEAACRTAMAGQDSSPDRLAPLAEGIRALGAVALEEQAACLATLPPG